MDIDDFINANKDFNIPFQKASSFSFDLNFVFSYIDKYNSTKKLKKEIVLITNHHQDCSMKTTNLDDKYCIVFNLNYLHQLIEYHEIIQKFTAASLLKSKELKENSANSFRLLLLKYISYKFCTNGSDSGIRPFMLNYFSITDSIKGFEESPQNTELLEQENSVLLAYGDYQNTVFTFHIMFILFHEIAHLYLNENLNFKKDKINDTINNVRLLIKQFEQMAKEAGDFKHGISVYTDSLSYLLKNEQSDVQIIELMCDEIAVMDSINYFLETGQKIQAVFDYQYVSYIQHSRFRNNLSGYNAFFNRFIPISLRDNDFNTDLFYNKLMEASINNMNFEFVRQCYIEEHFMHLGEYYNLRREANAENRLYVSNNMYKYSTFGWDDINQVTFSYLNEEAAKKWMAAIKIDSDNKAVDEIVRLKRRQNNLCTIFNWKVSN